MFQPTTALAWVKTKLSPGIHVQKADPARLEKLLWAAVETPLRAYLKALLEAMLKEELAQHLRAEPYERTGKRKDYRNGSYARSLQTKHGTIADLRVPRTLKNTFDPELFERYARRTKSADELIGQLFLNGISTRKLAKIAQELLGTDVSHATVGHIAGEISAKDCLQFQEKELKDEYRFLFLDGISAHIREIGVKRGVLLAAVGMKANGQKEIIGARLADSESEKDCASFLIDLKSRGLSGKALECITTDGAPGMLAALRQIYPYQKKQRCMFHKLRNVAAKLPMKFKEACMQGASLIFAAPSRAEAIRRFKGWKQQWEVLAEPAVKCMEKDLYECLTYYDFEKEVWKKIRTSNVIERSFREVRRRTRPMSIALPPHATERLFAGIAKNLNANWEKPFLKSPQFS